MFSTNNITNLIGRRNYLISESAIYAIVLEHATQTKCYEGKVPDNQNLNVNGLRFKSWIENNVHNLIQHEQIHKSLVPRIQLYDGNVQGFTTNLIVTENIKYLYPREYEEYITSTNPR